jgi:hypothetical protein
LSSDRYEIVFDNSFSGGGAWASVFAALKSLGDRGGAAIGGAYVLAARAFLRGTERLEDLNAERRFRERANGTPAARARQSAQGTTPGVSSGPQKSLPTKVST